MKRVFTTFWMFFTVFSAIFAQKITHVNVNKPNVNLRGNAVVLAQMTINAPEAGKVILRFDGHCLSSPGDRIVLAASSSTNWGANDGNVEIEAASDDINSNTFSHTRAYDVAAGEHVYYAIAQNHAETDGSGVASVFGTLTAQWFPETPGKAFARHIGFFSENIYVEGGPVAFNALTIQAPVSGKVLVRFDGKCVSSYGDLIFFAASNTLSWTNFDGSTSNEVIDNDLNRFSFSHVRTYNVAPGSHTYYAIAENFFEIYGNGFASIYGSLTVEFYPDAVASSVVLKRISTQLAETIDGPPVILATITMDAPSAGKVALNFVGTCVGNNGDQIRLAASDIPNWSAEDGAIRFEPYSSDLNRVSFSHTRVYDVQPGSHDYYAVIQNVEEFDGSGLAVVYGSLTAKFVSDGTSETYTPADWASVSIMPNPATDVVTLQFSDLAHEALEIRLIDQTGRVVKTVVKTATEYMESLRWDISALPSGQYFVQFVTDGGQVMRALVR